MPDPSAPVLKIYDTDPERGGNDAVAHAELQPGSLIRITWANPPDQARLENLFARVNGMSTFQVSIPPPDDAPRYEVHNRAVERHEPEFFQAMCDYLSKYHDLRLTFE